MQKLILMGFLGVFFSITSCAQSSDQKAIEQTIEAFSKAGDQNDVELLDNYLDEHYRIVMNRLFGSTAVSIVDKKGYLAKIESKEWGGDQRQLTFEDLVVNGTTASTKVTFAGAQMTFVSLVTLVKNQEGNWQLISEVPMIN